MVISYVQYKPLVEHSQIRSDLKFSCHLPAKVPVKEPLGNKTGGAPVGSASRLIGIIILVIAYLIIACKTITSPQFPKAQPGTFLQEAFFREYPGSTYSPEIGISSVSPKPAGAITPSCQIQKIAFFKPIV